MRVLGLDVATTTGWCLIVNTETPVAGAFKARGESDAEQASEYRRWLRALLVVHKPDFVGIEAPLYLVPRQAKGRGDMLGAGHEPENSVNNPKVMVKLHWLNMLSQMTCHELAIPFETVATATHRKSFLGAGKIAKGEAKKLALVQCQRIGMAIKSLDAADATSVAWWAAGQVRIGRARPGDLFA